MAAALGFDAPSILTERPVSDEMLPLSDEEALQLEHEGHEGHEVHEGHENHEGHEGKEK